MVIPSAERPPLLIFLQYARKCLFWIHVLCTGIEWSGERRGFLGLGVVFGFGLGFLGRSIILVPCPLELAGPAFTLLRFDLNCFAFLHLTTAWLPSLHSASCTFPACLILSSKHLLNFKILHPPSLPSSFQTTSLSFSSSNHHFAQQPPSYTRPTLCVPCLPQISWRRNTLHIYSLINIRRLRPPPAANRRQPHCLL